MKRFLLSACLVACGPAFTGPGDARSLDGEASTPGDSEASADAGPAAVEDVALEAGLFPHDARPVVDSAADCPPTAPRFCPATPAYGTAAYCADVTTDLLNCGGCDIVCGPLPAGDPATRVCARASNGNYGCSAVCDAGYVMCPSRGCMVVGSVCS
jgi:hypothetical protein